MTRQMADDEVLRVIDALGDLARHRLTMKRRDFDKMVAAGKEPHWAVVVKAERAEYLQEQACDLRAAVAALQAERDAALREISCCDDVNLGVPLAQSISELQQHRERAEAERDALRAGHGAPRVVDALHLSTGRLVTAKEVESLQVTNLDGWTLAISRGVQLERAESALEALRGQVAGLVGVIDARRALAAEIRANGMPPHSDYWHQSIAEAEERITAELLAIKERMG